VRGGVGEELVGWGIEREEWVVRRNGVGNKSLCGKDI
jgi:hypothetical protein